MDLATWTQRHFTEASIINWHCPNCNLKSLAIVKDKFVSEETKESSTYREKNDDWEPEYITYSINGVIECKNCNENIFFVGIGSLQENGYYDEVNDDFNSEYEVYFTPRYIHPTIYIFQIAEKCPDSVKEEIIDSFKLFWCDLESCANKIRISLEVLLDKQKVKKFIITSGKRKSITLHNRIQSFSNPEVKDLLLAIKWIGNTGSHKGYTLETLDIIEAYNLLESALNKLYQTEEKEMKKIAKEINKRKGPRKRKQL